MFASRSNAHIDNDDSALADSMRELVPSIQNIIADREELVEDE